ncbi:MAG: hypothetical protein PHY47_23785 [Lachnospiraceae bacterium]|nr:hypothetical protein [Lachnospiraceae bacterium]
MRVMRQPAKDIMHKLLKSRIEAESLKERDLRCPICNFMLHTIYSDMSGHLRVKCPKCKEVSTLNLAYFRRMKMYADRLSGK